MKPANFSTLPVARNVKRSVALMSAVVWSNTAGAICEAMYLMMAADQRVVQAERIVLRGALDIISDGRVRTMHMEAMLDARLATSCPLLLLTAGLLTARLLSLELSRYPLRFNVILSYDGESCAVRFHKIRSGQRWLAEDLEGYVDEGVLVFEAGGGAPVPALLHA